MKIVRTSKSSRGQASVEFLLSAVFLMTLILWAVQLVVAIYTYVILAEAAKEGVRYAIVHGSDISSSSGPTSGSACTPDATTALCSCTSDDSNVSSVEDAVINYASYLDRSNINVCYLDGKNAAPSRVQVTVSYPLSSMFTLGWTPPTIHASAVGRIQN